MREREKEARGRRRNKKHLLAENMLFKIYIFIKTVYSDNSVKVCDDKWRDYLLSVRHLLAFGSTPFHFAPL